MIDTRNLVETYSIVARDANTGELGVAVQTHQMCVGAVVPMGPACGRRHRNPGPDQSRFWAVGAGDARCWADGGTDAGRVAGDG